MSDVRNAGVFSLHVHMHDYSLKSSSVLAVSDFPLGREKGTRMLVGGGVRFVVCLSVVSCERYDHHEKGKSHGPLGARTKQTESLSRRSRCRAPTITAMTEVASIENMRVFSTGIASKELRGTVIFAYCDTVGEETLNITKLTAYLNIFLVN